jgi:hypothetical protein
MTNTKKTILRIVGGLVIAYFAITAIASTGAVVDDKGKPIKGAHVIATWSGNVGLFVDPHTRCYQLESTTTDENGRFKVSTFGMTPDILMTNRQRSIDVFVPGYYETDSPGSSDLNYIFAPLTGTKSDQFKKIIDRNFGGGCGNEKATLRFRKAVYAELVKLAESKEEKKQCHSLLFSIESIEFGDRAAEERATQRYRDEAKGSIK